MHYTPRHGRLLAEALGRLLGEGERGEIAFVRCLPPEIIGKLSSDRNVAPNGWEVWGITDESKGRSITADQAVEIREAKGSPALLLVDTRHAGAGMDGIYSAAREIPEADLYDKATESALREIKRAQSAEWRSYAGRALRTARLTGTGALTSWSAFDFLCRVAEGERSPGAHLHLLGLWPILDADDASDVDRDPVEDLHNSRFFLEHLLGPASASPVPSVRIQALPLGETSDKTLTELERFLQKVGGQPRKEALDALSKREGIWVGPLKRERGEEIKGIELISWRGKSGKLARWPGLAAGTYDGAPPRFYVSDDAEKAENSPDLEVRWKALPHGLKKGLAEYRVSVQTGMDEELAVKEITHSARQRESCRFTDEEFLSLSEGASVPAKIRVSVVGQPDIFQESEEFQIWFGDYELSNRDGPDIATSVRTFSEGFVESETRKLVSETVGSPEVDADTKRGFFVLQAKIGEEEKKKFRVIRSALVAAVESDWVMKNGEIGRWIVKVQESGGLHTQPRFEPLRGSGPEFQRVAEASRKFSQRFRNSGGAAQVYDEEAKDGYTPVREYLLAWAALLENAANPLLSLANTIEVRSRSDQTIGLIVLPAHPIRVAWHAGYDNLVLHTAFNQQQREPDRLRKELAYLDGALFPAFLPNPRGGSFVFADTIGFHAIAMVPDTEKEPKASVALLASAMGEKDSAESVPTVGRRSASVLALEIGKYLDCHEIGRLLRIHALRAGEGRTVARALGAVLQQHIEREEAGKGEDWDDQEWQEEGIPSFELDLYPSEGQQTIAGRFISDATERRRRGTSGTSVPPADEWMLEPVQLRGHNITMPRLRWSRKEETEPDGRAAHIAIAFDTFDSRVVTDTELKEGAGPCHAFGLLTYYQRQFSSGPAPHWIGLAPHSTEGEKHPSKRAHTEILSRLQSALNESVRRHLKSGKERPLLKTEISPEKEDSLKKLHRLSDWVVTLDHNAGLEYFDSPNDCPDIYKAYVIDAIPEREDLGCLQLITSTANLDEVRGLLDEVLDSMGLTRSRRNALFLLDHLKALSGRLAIRLTGQKPATAELIALALSFANCKTTSGLDQCWYSLRDGFIIPADDVQDLLPSSPKQRSSGKVGGEVESGRPDFLYVTVEPRKGLLFRFIEVKYRRTLRSARTPDLLARITQQTRSFRKHWEQTYCDSEICTTFRALRRARLARILRFYADKAKRHGLPAERYETLVAEIDRMVEKGRDYNFATEERGDRGWIFCPEYAGWEPQEISPDGWPTRVFLFGPSQLPDKDIVASIQGASEPSEPPPEETDEDMVSAPADEKRGGIREAAPDNGRSDAAQGPRQAPKVVLGQDMHTGEDIGWAVGTKGNPHLLLAGLPGMGKTTCLVKICEQMAKAKICPLVFSYHQDIDEKLEKAIGPVRSIDFDGLGFNPLKVMNRASKWGYLEVAGEIRDIFAAIFPDLGEVQLHSLRSAIKDSFEEKGWGPDQIADTEPPFGRFVEILRATPKQDRGLQTLLARLGELHDYGFFAESQSERSLWEGEQPTVIRIHATQNDNLQRAFAALVFYGLYKGMFRRGLRDEITHALIFDEAHRAARLKLIPTMAKECRKYGISLILASQEAADFDLSLFSAIANYLVLRCTEPSAKFLVRNVASSRQERDLIDQIKQMDKYKALFFGEGQSRPSRVALSP